MIHGEILNGFCIIANTQQTDTIWRYIYAITARKKKQKLQLKTLFSIMESIFFIDGMILAEKRLFP